ncbi:MAG: hypothetical protein HY805_06350 [Nitrospirae bacterium]|nr:hypothetical protein [Nitrospirota bacterium]
MGIKTLTVPEDALVNMLKTLPKDNLIEVFWRSVVETDVAPLTPAEREEIKKAKAEFKKGETVRWKDIR